MSGDVAALRKVAEAATPGPWFAEVYCSGMAVDSTEGRVAPIIADPNAAYIAAASPDVVLALLDRLEAAEAKVARVMALADEWLARNEYGDASLGQFGRDLRAALTEETP